MVTLKSPRQFKLLAGILSPALIAFTGLPFPLPALANHEQLISLEFPPSPGGAPSSTAGGGVRGNSSCISKGETPLTPLMPNNAGTTTAASPTLFVYVPKTTAKDGELVLLDDKGKEIAGSPVAFKLPSTSGIAKISLPTDVKLETEKEYTWQFFVICDPNDRGSDAWVQGTIRRTEINQTLKSAIDSAAPLKKAELYAGARIWNETLEIAAQLRQSDQTAWEQLLNSVGLADIASKPFVDIEQARN